MPEITLVGAVNQALAHEMAADEQVLVLGQELAPQEGLLLRRLPRDERHLIRPRACVEYVEEGQILLLNRAKRDRGGAHVAGRLVPRRERAHKGDHEVDPEEGRHVVVELTSAGISHIRPHRRVWGLRGIGRALAPGVDREARILRRRRIPGGVARA